MKNERGTFDIQKHARFTIMTLALSNILSPMKRAMSRTICAPSVALAVVAFAFRLSAQTTVDDPTPSASPIASLQLTPEIATQLQTAVDGHEYITAEKLLLPEIEHDTQSVRGARLLAYIGTIYFLNHDYLNAAVAWKKSEAIAPLQPDLRFSEAMVYVHMGHPEWARTTLKSLAAEHPRDALYPYWLGRLDYDGHEYKGAIQHFQRAVELDPHLARAYDNLGLSYFYENQNDLAVASYEKAIALNTEAGHPSPWPHLNLAITQQFLNQLSQAEANLREALRLDPGFAKAHFQLGTVLEDLHQLKAALEELKEAARLEPTYPEPHMALARIYHKMGQEAEARDEVKTYLRLHPHSAP
jgi:tetratricopeptide (TPR) repeat protein